jgi:hypothetical protein
LAVGDTFVLGGLAVGKRLASRPMSCPLLRVARPILSLALLGLAFAAQSGPAQAQGGLNDFFSQLFAPPQPSYVQSLVVPRGGHMARPHRAEPVLAPRRAHLLRPRTTERVHEVRLPRAAPLRVRHASLPLPATEPAGTSRENKDKVSWPGASEDKAQSTKPIKIAPREPDGDPATALMKDPTLRRGDIVVLPGGAKVFNGGRTAPYRLSDFDEVRSSKMLGDKTRQALMATPLQSAPKPAQTEAATGAVDQPRDKAQSGEDQRVAVTGSVPRRVGP